MNFFAAHKDFLLQGHSHCAFWNMKSGIWAEAEADAM
jgi:hypothetical protein